MDRRGLSAWILPSIGDVLFVSILAKTLIRGRDLLNDGDTGWHIATGMRILDTFDIPRSDIFSHTAQGAPWTAHEWLSEVIFALAHKAMGLNGVVVLCSVVIALTYYFMYRYMLKRGVDALLSAALTFLAAAAGATHWLARPHAFSFLLSLAFFVVLADYQDGLKNRLWSLPVLMLLWVNLHAGFFLGLMMAFLYALSNVPASLSNEEAARTPARRRLKALAITAAAVLVATFANPRGPALLLFPFNPAGHSLVMNNVQEWASANFHTEVWFELTLLVVLSAFVMSRKRMQACEPMLLLLLLHMSLSSVRFVPLFAVVMVPLISGRAGELVNLASGLLPEAGTPGRIVRRLEKTCRNASSIESGLNRHAWVYASIALCLAASLNGGSLFGARLMDYRHDPDRFPVAAMEFASENSIPGNMFNANSWGGYIIYNSPGIRVFFDGRYDPYGVEIFRDYLEAARARPGWSEVLDKYEVSWVLFGADSSFCLLLDESADWSLVYSDKTARIFLRDVPGNREIIDKYSNQGRQTT